MSLEQFNQMESLPQNKVPGSDGNNLVYTLYLSTIVHNKFLVTINTDKHALSFINYSLQK